MNKKELQSIRLMLIGIDKRAEIISEDMAKYVACIRCDIAEMKTEMKIIKSELMELNSRVRTVLEKWLRDNI